MPILLRTRYTPGTLTAVLLHVPIAITYIQALRRSEGPFERSDWIKTFGVFAAFVVLGVATPNVPSPTRTPPTPSPPDKWGPYDVDTPEEVANKPIAKPERQRLSPGCADPHSTTSMDQLAHCDRGGLSTAGCSRLRGKVGGSPR